LNDSVLHGPNDRVWVVFDWDEKGWQSFVSDPDVPPVMKEAGHKGRPHTAVLGGRPRILEFRLRDARGLFASEISVLPVIRPERSDSRHHRTIYTHWA
jgi:hypothetical protein